MALQRRIANFEQHNMTALLGLAVYVINNKEVPEEVFKLTDKDKENLTSVASYYKSQIESQGHFWTLVPQSGEYVN